MNSNQVKTRVNMKPNYCVAIMMAFFIILVFAIGGCNSSSVSTSVPSQPQTLAAQCGDCSATVTWTAPDNSGGEITGYIIYKGTEPDSLSVLTNVAAHAVSYCDETAENGVEYFYSVSAINSRGEGRACGFVTITPMTLPGEIIELDALGSDGVVNLSWTTPESDGGSDITTYHIYRGTSSGNLSELDTTVGSVVSYLDLSVVNGTTYYYSVSSENAAGEGNKCIEKSEMPHPEPTVASAPLDFSAVGSDGKVTLTWSKPKSNGYSPISDYKIYRMTGTLSKVPSQYLNDISFPENTSYHSPATVYPEYIDHTDSTITSFEDNSVINGTTYTYQVLAVNGVGDGQLCGGKSATPVSAPGKPTNLKWTDHGGTDGFTWDAPSDQGTSEITTYVLYWRQGTTGEFSCLREDTCTSAAFPSVIFGGSYHYQVAVTAVNDVGEGPMSDPISVH